jgi:hypothetical protein
LTEICSLSLITTTIANPSRLKFEQKVLHGDPQTLHYYLVDMHKLNLKIQEVMEFQKWPIAKLIPEKFSTRSLIHDA